MRIALGIPTRNELALAMLERDKEGFLLDTNGWRPDLIEVISADDDLAMTPERREAVDCIRIDFEETPGVPEVRLLLKHLQAVSDKCEAARRYLYPLFPCGYRQRVNKLACARIAGKLMLDV
jgi:TusE/DsrC/DsvC family sulfur relay protein